MAQINFGGVVCKKNIFESKLYITKASIATKSSERLLVATPCRVQRKAPGISDHCAFSILAIAWVTKTLWNYTLVKYLGQGLY